MSEYVKNKVIRRRVSKDYYDLMEFTPLHNGFVLTFGLDPDTSKYCYFLDKVLYHKYGANSGDYGRVRELTNEELKQYLPEFKTLLKSTKKKDLRYVDYCYYNGVDNMGYFEVGEYDYD